MGKMFKVVGVMFLAVVVLVIGTVGGQFVYDKFKSKPLGNGGNSADTTNFINTLNQSGTTTNATLPVLVVARNYSRQWVRITNDCIKTSFLFFNNYASGDTASPTVNVSTSTLLSYPLYSSSTLTFDGSNLYPGDVWAATSSVACKLMVTYQ